MIPTVGIAQIFLFLDGVIKQAYPWTQNNVDQYTAVFTNLTQQRHTVWIDVYCKIFSQSDGFNTSISQTLNFTIDAQAQTIAFHEDPVVTTRPGTRPTVVPPLPLLPTLNPTATSTPTVPEFPWLMILSTFLSLLSIVVLIRKKNLSEGYD